MKKTKKRGITPRQLAALKNGSEDAFNDIYCRYREPLLNFLHALLKDLDEAKEITQKVFIDIWIKKENIDPDKNIQGFLFRIARNYVMNYFDHEKVRKKYAAHSAVNRDFGISPEEHAFATDIDHVICLAIDRMPRKRQTVFKLKYENGMSYEEIARELSVRVETIRSHISTGRKELEKIFRVFIVFMTMV